MSAPHPEDYRRFGIREWMSSRWWLALAFSLVIILVLRSGTVGAPAQASVRPLDSLPAPGSLISTTLDRELPRFRRQLDLESELRGITLELSQLRMALAAEKSKADLLRESYDGLDAQFHEVASLLRSATVAESPAAEAGNDPRPASVPTPIEAIYVIDKREPGASDGSH